MRPFLFSLVMMAACSGEGDVVGPFTGETRRFIVDDISVPATKEDVAAFADDLDGDGMPDNELGNVIRTLAGMGNVTTHGAEIIASGAITTTVEIVANDFANDDTVSVKIIGAEGEQATATGGRFVDGVYRSNRTATTNVPGSATLHLPVFVHADPSVVPAIGLEIDLEPDGNGGYDALVRGGVPPEPALEAAYVATDQMLASYPSEHIGFIGIFDANPRDWKLERDEFVTNAFVLAMFKPDVTVRGKQAIAFGLRMHLSPCAEGTCLTATPTCSDRVKNGDETDVDCGGSCHGCVAGESCADPSDCETAACAGGVCGPASCTNGAHDSFESDVDCGRYCGTKCTTGERCYYDDDCAKGVCIDDVPCDPQAFYCTTDYGTCN